MNYASKILDKLYRKQWSVGYADITIEQVIKEKKIDKKLTWVPINNNHQFFADPFIFKSKCGEYRILFEELDYKKQYGYICQFTLNNKNQVVSKKVILETKSHLSYPFIFCENQNVYLFPESSANGKLSCFQYEENTSSVTFKKDILNLPLLDSTIIKYRNKYWIFCTMRGNDSNKKLYIFFSDSLLGEYTPHPQNPVKDNINGSRPAGSFIHVDGILYRPSQGSGKYYGSSIIINKVLELSEKIYKEESYCIIKPSKKEYFNFGIHTINSTDQMIVVDGLVRRFLPFTQLITFFRKQFIEKD